MSNENTPNNAGEEHNPHGLPEMEQFRFLCTGERVQKGDEFWHPGAKRWIESWNHIRADLWPISEIDFTYRRRTTPPTQSQEGETPETDALIERPAYVAAKLEKQNPDYAQYIFVVPADHAKRLALRLTIAQRENDRLRSEVKSAERRAAIWMSMIHGLPVEINERFHEAAKRFDARAATEEGKRG